MQYKRNPFRKDLLGSLKIVLYLKEHFALLKALKPFVNFPLIKTRTSFIYLFSYISRALSTKDKLAILTYHYCFLEQVFAAVTLKLLFGDGIECWSEWVNGEEFSVKMVHSAYLEFEGSLSLLFLMNSKCIYTMSFTIAAGGHFELPDEKVLYISRMQGTLGEITAITTATKALNDLIPPTILMSVAEGIGLLFGVKKIIGINARDQLSSGETININHYNNYDDYWASQGGQPMEVGDFMFSCPLHSKPIEMIKSKYRGRTIAKRTIRLQVAEKSFITVSHFIKKEFRENLTIHEPLETMLQKKNLLRNKQTGSVL